MKILQISPKILVLLLITSFISINCSSDDGDEITNQPPESFNLIEVPNAATDVTLMPIFSWTDATDLDGDVVHYDLYLDTNNSPSTKIANNITETSFTTESNLELDTTYYWKVVAKDDNGGETESEIFSFTTQVDYSSEALIGQWYFESIEEREPLSDCEKTSYLEFSSVGTAFTILYADSPDGGCNPLIVSEFTYELISETTIEFTNVSDNETSTTEIVSVSDTELVISGIGFFPPSTLIKG
ncbi:lipocalin family protein [Winogradskyella sp. F6397]|uniref:Lipocalin family protein n=1 Tax=Winogradskyella marina TaxID=2785530 RepID=A0ABS0EGK0_9FLAO|nr:lipocalin family protein [Winogradskyella marina]MBF8148590.1 lipocalin family protein [Winogradskyella marina]